MPVVDRCLDADKVRTLVRDQLSQVERESALEHLERCRRCADLFHRHAGDDTPLPRAVAIDALIEGPEASVIEKLIARLADRAGWKALPADSSETTLAGVGNGEDSFPFLAPSRAPDEMGRLGRYRVLRVLGSGGMGIVFLAEDTHLRRPVALKVMRPELASSGDYRERFLREARAAATIEHDHIVTVYHAGEEGGVSMLAMQMLQGETLEDRLKREGKLSAAEAARIGREIAEALHAAHGRGLVHRDIKPANVWLEGERRRVKVLDFGLARPLQGDGQLTRSGAIMGTPAYMAPEQAEGGDIDARADLFSLGAVLYRMVTGKPPFRGDNPLAVLRSLANDVPPPAHEVAPEVALPLGKLIQRMLCKDAAGRPASASQVAAELAVIEGSPQPQVKISPAVRGPSRRRWLVAASLAAVILGGAVFAGMFIGKGEGTLAIKVRVADVKIAINGKQEKVVGPEKSLEVPLSSGKHRLVATRGEDEFECTFTVKAGKTIEVVVPFEDEIIPSGDDPLRSLSAKDIPAAERLAWMPKELVRVWGTHAWKHWNAKHVQSSGTTALVFRDNGKTLIALDRFGAWHGGMDDANGDTAKTYDVATGRELRRFSLPNAKSMAYLPATRDVALLAGGQGEWTWRLRDIDTGAERVTIRSNAHFPYLIAASPDGKLVVTAGERTIPELWDVKSGKRIAVLALDEAVRATFASGAAFSPDSTRLVLTYTPLDWKKLGSTLLVFDAATHKQVAVESFPNIAVGAGRSVVEKSVAFTPDGKAVMLVATERSDASFVRFWDLAGKKWRPAKIAKDDSNETQPTLSPDGKRIAVDGAIYDASTGEKITKLGEPALRGPYTFSPDGKRVAGAFPWGQVAIFDTTTGKRLTPDVAPVEMLAVSPDGMTLALIDSYSGASTVVRLVDTLTGKERCKVGVSHLRPILSAAFAANGKILVTGTAGGVKFWNTADGEEVGSSPVLSSRSDILAVSADGRRVASGGFYLSEVKIWDAAVGKEVATIPLCAKGASNLASVALSGDGGILATNCNGTVSVFEVKGSKKRFTASGGGQYTCAVSPDGSRVAVAGKLYDGATGKEVAALKGKRPQGFKTLAFAPDGKTLFGASEDGRLTRWSVVDGSVVTEWQLPGGVKRVAVVAGGRYLFTSNNNGTVYVFRLAPPVK